MVIFAKKKPFQAYLFYGKTQEIVHILYDVCFSHSLKNTESTRAHRNSVLTKKKYKFTYKSKER